MSVTPVNMKGLQKIAKIREYCDYVEEHLNYVRDSWRHLQLVCENLYFISDDWVFWHIDALIENHDLSKMSAEEFIQYQEQFHPVDPDADIAERKCAFDEAWNHHKLNNPHHWQTWTTSKEGHRYQEQTMHCVCMVVDWMAMSMKFGGSAEQFYMENRDKINIPPWAEDLITNIFVLLREAKSPLRIPLDTE